MQHLHTLAPQNGSSRKNSLNRITARENLSEYTLGRLLFTTISGAMYPCFPAIPKFTPSGAMLSQSQMSTSPVPRSMDMPPSLRSW